MWKLIGDALREIAARPMAVFKVFWPLVVYVALAAAFVAAVAWALSFLPDELGRAAIGFSAFLMFLAIAFMLAFTFAPVAVNWHRVVILDEAPSWRPPKFREFLSPYAIRLAGFMLGFLLIHLLSDLVWKSFVWVLFADEDDYFISNIAWIKFISVYPNSAARFLFRYGSTIGELIVNALYFLVAGRWMLSLPASAVGQKGKDAKPPLLKILCAMFAVYAVPICLSGTADRYMMNQKYSNGYEPFWPLVAVGIIALFSFLLALTILSVAYRDGANMKPGMS